MTLLHRLSAFHIHGALGLRQDLARHLAQHPEHLNQCDSNGNTPLHLACQRHWFWGVVDLLEAGADPNLLNYQQESPLHLACASCQTPGQAEIIKYLLDYGARPEISLVNVLLYQVLTYFMPRRWTYNTPLHVACRHQNYWAVKYLLSARAPVNVPDSEGNTPFHLACQQGDRRLIDQLITAGARVDLVNVRDPTRQFIQMLLSDSLDLSVLTK